MLVSRALRPHGVNEFVVHVLLRVVNDLLNITRGVCHELSQSDGVVRGQVVVTNANGYMQIMNK